MRFEGIERSSPTPEVRDALQSTAAILVAPSNPIVSVGPILAVPGMLDEIAAARRRGVRVVGVSGIVGGRAIRGPADRMMAGLGEESSALGIARRYAALGLLDVFVMDGQDETLADGVRALGLEVVVTQTMMTDTATREQLAREMLAAATSFG